MTTLPARWLRAVLCWACWHWLVWRYRGHPMALFLERRRLDRLDALAREVAA